MSAVASNAEEDYELRLWMLNLFAHYVAVNKNWFETADESKYWGKLFLSEEDWEVPPPPWAITSEKNSDEYRSWVEEERQKLLKEEEKEAVVDIKLEVEKDQPRVSDACTQTPKRRRSGRRASRMRRLLAYQLMLTRKRGLPPSRLQLTLEEADARPSKREELKRKQEESASSFLMRKNVVGMKADNTKEKNSDHFHLDEEEEEGHISVGTSTGDQPHFTPRSFQADPVTSTPFQPPQAVTSFSPQAQNVQTCKRTKEVFTKGRQQTPQKVQIENIHCLFSDCSLIFKFQN